MDNKELTYGEAIAEIEELIKSPESKCVALGEIGLDYHYPDTDKVKQWEAFDMQMRLAEKLALPVVIHDREAHGDVMDMIRKYPCVHGILHSYSGSPEMATELVRRGCTPSRNVAVFECAITLVTPSRNVAV